MSILSFVFYYYFLSIIEFKVHISWRENSLYRMNRPVSSSLTVECLSFVCMESIQDIFVVDYITSI